MPKPAKAATSAALSFPVSTDKKSPLYLVRVPVAVDAPVVVAKPPPTHHVMIIDCSGSMYSALPRIREQLKSKLPTLLSPGDFISIIWFSGRGQCDALVDCASINGPADISKLNTAIDRWLTAQCLTGFVDPLRLAAKVIERAAASKASASAVVSVLFMSDGCDNEWGRPEIMGAVAKLAGVVNSMTIVEYGYYADRALLTAMAEKGGGALIFAVDFDAYAPVVENVIGRRVRSVARKSVEIVGDAVGGFAYALHDGDLLTYGVEDGSVDARADLDAIYYLSTTPVGTVSKHDIGATARNASHNGSSSLYADDRVVISAAYAALGLYANRLQGRVVDALLSSLGDKAFAKSYGSAIGKDKVSAFVANALAASNGSGRWVKGYDPACVPPADAFTVLDLLDVLSSDPANRLLMEHPAFKYAAIGRGREDASEQLTPKEAAEIQALTESIKGVKDATKIKEYQKRIDAILNAKGTALLFVADPAPDGYALSNITLNESRPNVSVLVRKTGTVNVSARVPAEHKGKVPEVIATAVWRNYALVKDGLINVRLLPVRVTRPTWDCLFAAGVPTDGDPRLETDGSVTVVLDLAEVPIINRNMVTEISAKALFEAEWDLLLAQAKAKVYGHYKKLNAPKTASASFVAAYGEPAAEWLKTIGLTDGGFSPKSTVAASVDFYMAKQVDGKIAGYSALPSVNDVLKKRDKITDWKKTPKGKEPTYTASEALMLSHIEVCEALVLKHGATGAALQKVLTDVAEESTADTRRLIRQAARVKFSITVGGAWPKEWKSLDENTIEVKGKGTDGKPVQLVCTLDLTEKKQLI